MRVLVACEFSGRVRDAFIKRGHDAWSCDLLDTESPGPHIKSNVLDILNDGWDMLLGFPPCTYLTVANAHSCMYGDPRQEDALQFVAKLMNADIEKICIENPIGKISTRIMKPTQIIQPWMFGEPETKKTCLWLFGLPKLKPQNTCDPTIKYPIYKANNSAPSKDRWKLRSQTYIGIAEAMAEQWG